MAERGEEGERMPKLQQSNTLPSMQSIAPNAPDDQTKDTTRKALLLAFTFAKLEKISHDSQSARCPTLSPNRQQSSSLQSLCRNLNPSSHDLAVSPAQQPPHSPAHLKTLLLLRLLSLSTIPSRRPSNQFLQRIRRVFPIHEHLHNRQALALLHLFLANCVPEFAVVRGPLRDDRVGFVIHICAEIRRCEEVVPGLDVVVGSLHSVDEALDCVSVIIDYEDCEGQFVPDHGSYEQCLVHFFPNVTTYRLSL